MVLARLVAHSPKSADVFFFFYYLMCVFVVFFGAQCVQLPLPDDMVASTFAVLLLFDFNTEEFDYALNLEKKIIMK